MNGLSRVVHNADNVRPFTTIGTTREKPIVDIVVRPNTVQSSCQSQVRLPKLNSSNRKFSVVNKETLVNNYVNGNNDGYHGDDGNKSCAVTNGDGHKNGFTKSTSKWKLLKNRNLVNGNNDSNHNNDGGSSNGVTNGDAPRNVLTKSASKWKFLRKQSLRKISTTGVEGTGLKRNSMNGPTARPASAWDAFSDHIKHVNDSSSVMEFEDKNLDFNCSDAFKRIMHELGPRKVKKTITRRSDSFNNRNKQNFDENYGVADQDEEQDETAADGDGYTTEEADSDRRRPQRRRAMRAWALVRRHIQEIRVERRRASASINWDFLRQTVSALSNMEKSRQDLYDKYIYKPNWWANGLTRCPEHLVKKYQNTGPLLPLVPPETNTHHSTPASHGRTRDVSRQSRPPTRTSRAAQMSVRKTRPATHTQRT